VLFVNAPALVAALVKAHTDGRLEERLGFLAKPKLLIADELGYLSFEPNAAHLFFQFVSPVRAQQMQDYWVAGERLRIVISSIMPWRRGPVVAMGPPIMRGVDVRSHPLRLEVPWPFPPRRRSRFVCAGSLL
jgi:IstB-like ATP binding protein